MIPCEITLRNPTDFSLISFESDKATFSHYKNLSLCYFDRSVPHEKKIMGLMRSFFLALMKNLKYLSLLYRNFMTFHVFSLNVNTNFSTNQSRLLLILEYFLVMVLYVSNYIDLDFSLKLDFGEQCLIILVQKLDGFNSANVSGILRRTKQLRQAGVRTICQ